MSKTMPILAWLPVAFAVSAGSAAAQAAAPGVTITYLYDNTTAVPGTQGDWGFACLVETAGRRVLFDTGTKPEILRANVRALKIDLAKLDALVFSHEHTDHTGGVGALGSRPGLPAFFPASFSEATRARFAAQKLKLTAVTDPTSVVPGVMTGGQIGAAIPEEALVVDTDRGLVVIVGCAHPGIVEMLRGIAQARGRPIHAVIGGFHLMRSSPDQVAAIIGEMRAMKVAYAGPTHCTGDAAIASFREAYGARFIEGGVGRVLHLPLR